MKETPVITAALIVSAVLFFLFGCALLIASGETKNPDALAVFGVVFLLMSVWIGFCGYWINR